MSSIETPDHAKEHLLHQDDSSDGIGIPPAERRLAADDQEDEKQPLRRYWIRPLVAVFIPTIVTAYYGVIWFYIIQGQGVRNDKAVKYYTFSGSLVFYSWFIISVFCLSWSKYGLIGLEVSMLRFPFWQEKDTVVLMRHYNSTWSSPSGWIKAMLPRGLHQRYQLHGLRGLPRELIRELHELRKLHGLRGLFRELLREPLRGPPRLWTLLAFLSILPFFAIPLSGLVFELSDGYIKTSAIPNVRGKNSTTFNERYDRSESLKPAPLAWQLGSAPNLPGIGVIYTTHSVDRSEHSIFKEVPNTFPLSESIPDLFLAPQADKPVSGKAWGLRIKYDCSIVRSASQFTILSEKPASSVVSYSSKCLENKGTCVELQTPSKHTIALHKSTSPELLNVGAYFEIGIKLPSQSPERYRDFEADEGDASLVFEYAAWQYRNNGSYGDTLLPFNATVEPSIKGMGSPFVKSGADTYTINSTFFVIKGDVAEGASEKARTTNVSKFLSLDLDGVVNRTLTHLIDVAAPIGVRCVSSSAHGTAELDGTSSTFRDFQRADPYVEPAHSFTAPRFGDTAIMALDGQFYAHYLPGGLSGLRPQSNTNRYSEYIDALSLLRSTNLAYATDAFELIYGVSSGFKGEWPEPGLTSSRKGKILSAATLIPAAAPGHIVFALLCVWATLSAGLGVWYGFRKKPADSLDGDTILRKGVHAADELKQDKEFMRGKPLHESRALTGLPRN